MSRVDAPVAFLYGLTGTSVKLGLERMQAFLSSLGNPERAFETLVVGGTNGKGSVTTWTAEALRRSGRRTGLYRSPHVRRYNERISVDGTPIESDAIAEFVARHRKRIESTGATFFEVTTAMAFAEFQRREVEVAVLEVGMGGRLDATNVTDPVAAAITTIERDHVRALGETRAEIAGEKYPISRPGRPLVLGKVGPEISQLIRGWADRDGVPLREVGRVVTAQTSEDGTVTLTGPFGELAGLKLSLAGEHQVDNAATVCALLDAGGYWPGSAAVREALEGTILDARFQAFEDAGVPIVVDVAHNGAGLAACLATWKRVMGSARPVVVFSALGDKDLPLLVRRLAGVTDALLVPPLDSHRAVDPSEVTRLAERAGVGSALACDSTAAALEEARELVRKGVGDAVLCVGSFHLAGAVLDVLDSMQLTGRVPWPECVSNV